MTAFPTQATSETRGQRRRGVASKETLGTEGPTWRCSWRAQGGLLLHQKNQKVPKPAKPALQELLGWADHRSPTFCQAQRGTRENRSTSGMAERPPPRPKERGWAQGETHWAQPHGLAPVHHGAAGYWHRVGCWGCWGGGGSPLAPSLTPLPAPCLLPGEAPLPAGPGLE